jgi:hypothetical protein
MEIQLNRISPADGNGWPTHKLFPENKCTGLLIKRKDGCSERRKKIQFNSCQRQ